jgi:hypothetical protein
MSIPNYVQPNFENGEDNSNYHLQQQQLTKELQTVLSDQGIKIPSLTSSQISALNTSDYIGRIVFNSSTKNFMGNDVGVFKNFTLV